jgi:hypothetical protein
MESRRPVRARGRTLDMHLPQSTPVEAVQVVLRINVVMLPCSVIHSINLENQPIDQKIARFSGFFPNFQKLNFVSKTDQFFWFSIKQGRPVFEVISIM